MSGVRFSAAVAVGLPTNPLDLAKIPKVSVRKRSASHETDRRFSGLEEHWLPFSGNAALELWLILLVVSEIGKNGCDRKAFRPSDTLGS